jgi:hypothetical protein
MPHGTETIKVPTRSVDVLELWMKRAKSWACTQRPEARFFFKMGPNVELATK